MPVKRKPMMKHLLFTMNVFLKLIVMCSQQLASFETDYALMIEFFPDGVTSKEPQVSRAELKAFILNEIGFCLIILGRPREAAPFQERAVQGYLECQDWHDACVGSY